MKPQRRRLLPVRSTGSPGLFLKKKPRMAGAVNRRTFVKMVTNSAAAGFAVGAPGWALAKESKKPLRTPRKRIAILATEVRKLSHPQHFIDRFLEGYGWQGRFHHPTIELAGLYVDQFPS